MKLDKNLTESINYAQILFTDLGRLLLLIVLDIIPIVNLIVVGYVSRVVKESPYSTKLPPLEHYWDLWVRGLKIVVAAIIYMIIPIILVVPFVFLTVLAGSTFLGLPTVGWVVAMAMLIFGIVLAFFLAIVLAMAVANMIWKGNFRKAFAFGEIVGIVGRVGWGSYLLWLLVVFICGLMVAGIGSIPTVGWILSGIIGPIFGVFAARSASITYLEGVFPDGSETVEMPKATTKKFCTSCGRPQTAEALYCPKCGNKH